MIIEILALFPKTVIAFGVFFFLFFTGLAVVEYVSTKTKYCAKCGNKK